MCLVFGIILDPVTAVVNIRVLQFREIFASTIIQVHTVVIHFYNSFFVTKISRNRTTAGIYLIK